MNNDTTQTMLLKIPEVCALLGGISSKTVYRLLDRGELTAHPAFRHKLISRQSVEVFARRASA